MNDQLSLFPDDDFEISRPKYDWYYCSHCKALNFTTPFIPFLCDNCDLMAYPLHDTDISIVYEEE